MITGTLTLRPLDLAEMCDAVYLLAEAELDPQVTVTYEASVDGGNTWAVVEPGELTAVGHSGDILSARVTMTMPDGSGQHGVVRWLVCYATREA